MQEYFEKASHERVLHHPMAGRVVLASKLKGGPKSFPIVTKTCINNLLDDIDIEWRQSEVRLQQVLAPLKSAKSEYAEPLTGSGIALEGGPESKQETCQMWLVLRKLSHGLPD
eukprot:1153589-Pelagomonas_calceolata.AAC.2